jgi:hypothetical protein
VLEGRTRTSSVEQPEDLLLLRLVHVHAGQTLAENRHFLLLDNVLQGNLGQVQPGLRLNEPTALLVHQFGSQARGNGVLNVLFRNILLDALVKGNLGDCGRKMRSVT